MRCFVLIAALTSGLLFMPVTKSVTKTAAALPAAMPPPQSLAGPPAQLISGPMVAPATSMSASVWLEADDRSVLLRLIDHRGDVRLAHRLSLVDLRAPSPDGSGRASPQAGDDEFTPLFDGETLEGWVVENTDAGNISVQDGILRVDGPGGWLRSEKTYSDFDLRAEFRFLTDDADSGIFVRASDTTSTFARGWPSGSYQVQTRDITSNLSDRPLLLGDLYRHGMPDGETDYDADAAQEAFLEIGEWQEFEITVGGDSLLVHLNGVPITRATGIANPSGYLGIQGETDTVEFRAIEIREH